MRRRGVAITNMEITNGNKCYCSYISVLFLALSGGVSQTMHSLGLHLYGSCIVLPDIQLYVSRISGYRVRIPAPDFPRPGGRVCG